MTSLLNNIASFSLVATILLIALLVTAELTSLFRNRYARVAGFLVMTLLGVIIVIGAVVHPH